MLYITALIVFFAIHIIPLKRPLREKASNALGTKMYLGLFSLISLGSVALMVLGWNAFPNIYFYEPPTFMKHIHMAIMLPVLYLWVAAEIPNNLKRFIKHPMLTGMKLWALGHLLANGDLRSMLLFITTLVFSVIAVIVINKRNETKEIQPTPVTYDIATAVISLAGYGLLAYFHDNLFGVPILASLT